MSEATIFHVVFTESDNDPARDTEWQTKLRGAFVEDRPPRFWITAEMTQEEFRNMTGRDNVEDHVGYVLEHYDGPGVFGTDMVMHDIDGLVDAINNADNDGWQLMEPEDITPAGWQAMVNVMRRTLSLDWEVQPDLVDGNFVDQHQAEIALFLKPVSDC